MSGRRGQLTREQQAEVGALVIALRRGAVPVAWKDIEGLFHVERTQLWRYARRHVEKMQQQTSKMQQQDCCVSAPAA